MLLEALTQAGLEKTKFELHSLRSGGVSEAAQNVSPRGCLKHTGDGSLISLKMGILKKI